MRPKNRYAFIFVHGMFGWGGSVGIDKISPYWGSTAGNLMKYLSECGYECYSASVGPVSSAWDCACELYAQLAGKRVDYGAAHSEFHSHQRYGRTYTKPLIGDFGKTKIHLIGHSHGGQVIRLLAHLLTYGDENEIKATDKNDISDLFTGGKEEYISSITTLCTPNNGTTLYSLAEKANIISPIGNSSDFVMALVGRTFIHGRLVDYQLEQYGLTPLRGEKKADKIFTAMKRMSDTDDNVLTDLSFKGAYELNKRISICKNINYFCYTSSGCVGDSYKTKNIRFPLLKPLARLIANADLPEEQYGLNFDDSWRQNDGLVNTPSGRNPIDEPAKIYDGNIEPGIWNIMPDLCGDHGQAAGLFAYKNKLRSFYTELAEMLVSTETEESECQIY